MVIRLATFFSSHFQIISPKRYRFQLGRFEGNTQNMVLKETAYFIQLNLDVLLDGPSGGLQGLISKSEGIDERPLLVGPKIEN